MDAAQLRALCLGFAGAYEDFPFGPESSVFKVRAPAGGEDLPGKMFALASLDVVPLRVALKCDPVLAVQLRAAHPEITGAWHMNKRHWSDVRLDGSLTDSDVRDLVEDSYDLVVAGLPRAQREALGWSRLAR
ncbi:MmcQ/YjbR family DNA-binding protein [Sinomonas notoginsengisoli]|uniref:MmcQ/YjbR family DNA-binding protein n=1 Tax=Sinomonas notoginsengisoli TaxID=1457311 RepID=UPI001F186D0E|nr:MmcQ/YjbR family DNA-binding protein [Sinomonas notoginsengisoli]